MIKDIVVHLTGSEEDEVRIGYAEAVASQFDAHVTGLFVHLLPEVTGVPDAYYAAGLEEWTQESRQRAEETRQKLVERLNSLSCPHEVRQITAYSGTAANALATEAQAADLFVGTRPYGDSNGAEWLEEGVLFNSGRGCLFVPPDGKPPQAYRTVLIAWKNTREAAHAVAEAMPFLRQAKQVIVAIVEEGGAAEQYGIEPGADIGRHLSRHGITAEIRTLGGWTYPGEAILNEAKRSGADLVVMGGYGHSRLREWVLGGATRHLLTHADIPVLMAR